MLVGNREYGLAKVKTQLHHAMVCTAANAEPQGKGKALHWQVIGEGLSA